ncbi:MAG: hypothetical protein OQK98_06560 [Gammaproteobacteria bacterium]|nr:hypothetical protein [Gammaproteobacteria bacterium]
MLRYIKTMGLFLILAVSFSFAYAEDKPKTGNSKKSVKKDNEVKELSGISIIGNKEAPKSLYIVPWKNSEVGVRSSLTSGLLDESMRPVDKEVFLRELDFYELSH